MNVKIISDLSGEMQFDMSAENLVQLIGAATRYAADKPSAAKDAVQEYAHQPEVKKEKPARRVESMFGDYRSRIPVESVLPEVQKADEGYKGFLLIECKACGKLRGFHAKIPISKYVCSCGGKTPLKNLRPAFLKCKCGSTFKYMTNIEDEAFTYNCLDCDAPIDLEENHSRSAFVTVGSNRY